MTFDDKPIVVLGVNHAGTRVLVDILSALGSDGGSCRNEWRENQLFLDVHREMLGAKDRADWTTKLFDLKVAANTRGSAEHLRLAKEMLAARLDDAYPHRTHRPWHWKCPTSALYLDVWTTIFPDAYYIHIVRDALDVAQSLLARRQFYSIQSAVRFYELLEARIAEPCYKRYLRLNYTDLGAGLEELMEFLPFLSGDALDAARGLIHAPRTGWKHGRSLRHNLWSMSAALRIALAKRVRARRMA